MSQHIAGSRLTSNIKITLKITFTSEIFADITRPLAVVLQHLKFCKKILILIFFLDLFSVECKFFCPNSADNTMENRAISLVESSRDNSLIACRTSSDYYIFAWLLIKLCQFSICLTFLRNGLTLKDSGLISIEDGLISMEAGLISIETSGEHDVVFQV